MFCLPIMNRNSGSQRSRALAGSLALSALLLPAMTSQAVDFAKDIEPILVKRCSECHGPDKQKGDLRLDSRSAAIKPAKSGKTAVAPGKPEDSELLVRVLTNDPDEVMPPKGNRLTDAEVASLKEWIASGAKWAVVDPTKHWSFVKPVRPPIPQTKNTQWGHNEMDRFILARLEKSGLSPQPEADRPTLIRRLSLDITGLPPTWKEVQDFVQDTAPNAYEKLVDRLLTSPHRGEHLARWWLDLARYADSNGYQVDLTRQIWPYRDYVLKAFNENKPFDQFTIEQLAGDLLPSPTTDQLIATGFNRNTKINDEGGGDAEEYRVKAVKDRVTTVGTTWLGLTLTCAECHTHKYDPITHDEYYQLYAIFNNSTDGGNYSVEPSMPVTAPDLSDSANYVRSRKKAVEEALAKEELRITQSLPAWEKAVAERGDVWQTLKLVNASSTGGSTYTNLADGSILGTGVNPIYDTITVEAETDLDRITAVMLEVLPDPSLPQNGPGRWRQTGNFILDEMGLWAVPVNGPIPANTNVVFAGAQADWFQLYYRPEHAVDGNPKTGWAIGPRFGQRHFLVAELQEPISIAGKKRLGFRFDHYHGNSHTLGRFRLSVTAEKNPAARWPVPSEVLAGVRLPANQRSPEIQTLIGTTARNASAMVRELDQDLFRLKQRDATLANKQFVTLVMKERTNAEPRKTHVQVRGNFLEKGREVQPGVPALFPPAPANAPMNRLTFAQWLVGPDHPLTARVTVNQVWERIFGVGLVKTSEDFGRQGEPPSNQEVLDWLATEFIRSGWDLKALQKTILMSASYRQLARTTPENLEKDPENRLLSRGPRFRMDGEMIRDHALAVSGLLNPKVGGPSVHPVQVANLWKEIGFLRPEIGMDEWPVSEGPDLYRRGVYTFWRRVCTYPTFATFDAPSRDQCTAKRPRTNTPLQALAGLNEPSLLEAARVFAQRILTEGGSTVESRVEFAFKTCVNRAPTRAERQRLVDFLEQQQRGFQKDPAAAEALLSIGAAPRPSTLDARTLAAWMMVANALFNLDESLTKG